MVVIMMVWQHRWSNQQLPRGLPGMGCPFLRLPPLISIFSSLNPWPIASVAATYLLSPRSRQDGGTSLCLLTSRFVRKIICNCCHWSPWQSESQYIIFSVSRPSFPEHKGLAARPFASCIVYSLYLVLCRMPSSTCQLLLMFNHILSLPIVNQISLNLIQQSDLTNSKIFLSQNFSNAVNRRILPWDWTQTPINGHQHWEGDHQSGRCELENHCENQSLHTDTCIGPVDMAIHVSACIFLVKFCEQYGGILLDKPQGRTCWCENLRERGNFPCGGNKKDWRLLWGVIART